ncbi:MAG: DUF523 domain-containing protein [Desulfobacterales bacterium]|nr:DUF523 domain-containing protein [Desulfobacterales bacterium]
MSQVKIGISSCLAGYKVRYNGLDKKDSYLLEMLIDYNIQYIPVCPEVESGFGIPREPFIIIGNRLIAKHTQIDYTDRIKIWAKNRLIELNSENICGFIFKSMSPSCGKDGIFLRIFMEYFPFLPIETESTLRDQKVMENFIQKIINK